MGFNHQRVTNPSLMTMTSLDHRGIGVKIIRKKGRMKAKTTRHKDLYRRRETVGTHKLAETAKIFPSQPRAIGMCWTPQAV